jgi:hypothetical protein
VRGAARALQVPGVAGDAPGREERTGGVARAREVSVRVADLAGPGPVAALQLEQAVRAAREGLLRWLEIEATRGGVSGHAEEHGQEGGGDEDGEEGGAGRSPHLVGPPHRLLEARVRRRARPAVDEAPPGAATAEPAHAAGPSRLRDLP